MATVSRRSLGARGIFFFCSVLLIILSVITVMNVSHQQLNQEQLAKEHIKEFGELVLVAMKYPMLMGDQDIIQKQFDGYRLLSGMEVADLTDKNGVIKRSLDGNSIGLKIGSSRLDEALQGKEFHAIEMRKRTGALSVQEMYPIRNEKQCYACHGSTDKVLGVLRLDLDWQATLRTIRSNRNWNILLSVVGLLTMSLLIGIFFLKAIVRPIKRLEKGMKTVSQGDLDLQLAVETEDEIGTLTTWFNKMTQDLKTLLDEERRKTEEVALLNQGLDNEIIERKDVEEKLKQSLKDEVKSREIMSSMLEDNNLIRERLEKSMEKLRETQGQLIRAEKMEAIGRMASGIAHEVKNPLGIILQGINYFEAETPGEQQSNREMLVMMKDGVKRADRIIRALLEFSRTEEMNLAPQDMNSIIDGSLDMIRHRIRLNAVEFVRDLAQGLPQIMVDRGRIEQVLINLFNNALDAMPKGGKLFVRSYQAEAAGEKVLVVEVEDTGTGIDDGAMNKIFDPFFTTKNRAEGTGLGLSISKSIVEMHGGTIKVATEKGKGTKFTMQFKLREGG